MKKIFIFTFLIFFITSINFPLLALADEVASTETPTPTPVIQNVDNNATVSTDTTSNSNTGDNNINITPTPTPSDAPTPAITQGSTILTPTIEAPPAQSSEDITATNSAEVTNQTSTSANTGGNTTNTNEPSSATPTPTSANQNENSTTLTTGDAVSTADVENNINSTSINSNIIQQTVNLYVDQTGNLDLTDPSTIINNAISAHPNDPIINVSVINVNNYAYLSNTIVSTANTGGNNVNAEGETTNVTTGNAYSLVKLVNKVNFTVINSTIHIITVNIFGHLNGNLILPDAPTNPTTCSTCGTSVSTQNSAIVNNTTSSLSNTGNNSLTTTGSSSALTTGNAASISNSLNFINLNMLGVNAQWLYINIFGNWNGNFLGWGNLTPQQGGGSLALFDTETAEAENTCQSCQTAGVNINNKAIVNNNIVSSANTGNNNIKGDNVSVTTGNAYSSLSLINFINSNFIGVNGFFGFINIFGDWTGDIGQESAFVTPTPTPDEPIDTKPTNGNNTETKENGGKLAVTQTNNVGEYVLPGDTVTFFINSKNVGTGKIYDAKLNLFLVYNGQSVGGKTYNLGNIDAGKGVKVTTGFVLSKNAPAGYYIAVAEVTGQTGDGDVKSSSDSNFTVNGITNSVSISNGDTQGMTNKKPQVLGTSIIQKAPVNDQDKLLLVLILSAYLLVRILNKKEYLKGIFIKGLSFKERAYSIRIFLL